MLTLAELLLALHGRKPLTRQERRLIARQLSRLIRECGCLDLLDG